MAMNGPVLAPPTVCPCGPASGMANLLAKGVSTTDGGDDDGSTAAKIDSNSKQPWKVMVVGYNWNMLVIIILLLSPLSLLNPSTSSSYALPLESAIGTDESFYTTAILPPPPASPSTPPTTTTRCLKT
ncbi:hypothetical protein L6452_30002 [Arctium lappa]|uniref:Uncharacterized protein n=1 Tax=Arctium lappa TaxID=4217 RepID=A0ACB8ZM04_ARCLA|nr:hypothetical protein L6452_30002 [Arctium lappa]